MLGLCLFHAIQALLVLGVRDATSCRAGIQNGCWIIKILALAGIIVGCFFIPGSNLVGYGWAALVGGTIFILVQMVLLLDFAYVCNKMIKTRYEDSRNCLWALLLVVFLVALYGLAVCLTTLLYIYFTPGNSVCAINTAFVTANLIGCVLVSILAMMPFVQEHNPDSGLLQAAMVTAYASYLVWSSIASEPQTDYPCNRMNTTNAAQNASIIVGVVFTFIAVLYGALSTRYVGAAGAAHHPAASHATPRGPSPVGVQHHGRCAVPEGGWRDGRVGRNWRGA